MSWLTRPQLAERLLKAIDRWRSGRPIRRHRYRAVAVVAPALLLLTLLGLWGQLTFDAFTVTFVLLCGLGALWMIRSTRPTETSLPTDIPHADVFKEDRPLPAGIMAFPVYFDDVPSTVDVAPIIGTVLWFIVVAESIAIAISSGLFALGILMVGFAGIFAMVSATSGHGILFQRVRRWYRRLRRQAIQHRRWKRGIYLFEDGLLIHLPPLAVAWYPRDAVSDIQRIRKADKTHPWKTNARVPHLRIHHLDETGRQQTTDYLMDAELSCRWDELRDSVRQWSWAEASGRVPDSAEHRAHLRRLDLSNKRLDRLPEGLTAYTNVRWLDLSYNSLSHLPSDLRALCSLRVLDASGNPLLSIAPDLVELQEMGTVRLDWERLSHEVGTTQVPSEVVAFTIKRTDGFVGDEVLTRVLDRCASFNVCLALRDHVNRTVTSWSDRRRLLQDIEAVQHKVPQGDGSLSLATEAQGGLTVRQPEGHLSMHAGNDG